MATAAAGSRNFASEAKPHLAKAAAKGLVTNEDRLQPQHILVCGWRKEWDATPARFRSRLKDIVGGLATPLGSSVTCVAAKDAGEMHAFFGAAGLVHLKHPHVKGEGRDDPSGDQVWTLGSSGVEVRHREADSTSLDDMRALVEVRQERDTPGPNTAIQPPVTLASPPPVIIRTSR